MRTTRHNGWVSLMATPLLAIVVLSAANCSESGLKDSKYTAAPDATEIKKQTITDEPTYSAEELEMLACVIYQEAGGDACCDNCRRRVADTALNRVADKRFPDTLEEVLTQKQQYGRFYWTGIVWPQRAEKAVEFNAVERAYRIAKEVLEGHHSELYAQGYIWQAEFEQGADTFKCCNIYYGR